MKFGNWFEFETKLDYEAGKAIADLSCCVSYFKESLDYEEVSYEMRG